MMEYKGYLGDVQFDDQAGIFHGEIVNLRDVVTFQGKTVNELRRAFRESGKFVVRVSPELHRRISLAARKSGKSLNAWVAERLSRDLPGAR